MLYTSLSTPQCESVIFVEIVQWTNIKNYKFIHFSSRTNKSLSLSLSLSTSLFFSLSIHLFAAFNEIHTSAQRLDYQRPVASNNNPPLLTSKSLFTQMKVFRLEITSNYSAFNRALSHLCIYSVFWYDLLRNVFWYASLIFEREHSRFYYTNV